MPCLTHMKCRVRTTRGGPSAAIRSHRQSRFSVFCHAKDTGKTRTIKCGSSEAPLAFVAASLKADTLSEVSKRSYVPVATSS